MEQLRKFVEESKDNSTSSEDTYHIFEVQLDNYLHEPRVSHTTNIYAR